ncbi:hypothetical protein [Sulfitobacter sp. PM12]|uniref:hypothetical protein n=1 Tax=Sulfitobacter sp. PM12 TaxID=3138497 RepID=UPI00388E81ED
MTDRAISRAAFVRALIKYHGLTEGEALDVLRWKRTADDLAEVDAAPAPLAFEPDSPAPLGRNDAITKSIVQHFGLKLAVVDLIFRKG